MPRTDSGSKSMTKETKIPRAVSPPTRESFRRHRSHLVSAEAADETQRGLTGRCGGCGGHADTVDPTDRATGNCGGKGMVGVVLMSGLSKPLLHSVRSRCEFIES